MKKMWNFKEIIIILSVVLAALGNMGCTESNRKAIQPFCGEWNCRETAEENTEYYTGYMKLHVEEDGTFSIYDAEAGNPGICGKMKIDSDDTLTLTCDDSEDFDPPATWESMQTTQKIRYKFVDEHTLKLIYTEEGQTATLVFDFDS